MTQVHKLIAIILFVLILFSSLLCTLFGVIPGKPIFENRRRKPIPEGNIIAKIWKTPKYASDLNAYINDNYPIRDLLIKTKNQIDYTLFNVSDRLFIGIDQHLFYKSIVQRDEVAVERMSQDKFDALCRKIYEAEQQLKKRGVEFFFFVCPQKNTVYPELLPNPPIRRPDRTLYKRLTQYLESNPELSGKTLNVEKALLNLGRVAYYKADFHWTDYAATKIGDEMLAVIFKYMNQKKPYIGDIIFEETPGLYGGQNNDLATFYPIMEMKQSAKAIESRVTLKSLSGYRSSYYFSNDSTSTDLLPRVLVIGNSYIDGVIRNHYFWQFFHDGYKIDSNSMMTKHVFPEDVKICVVQVLESQLDFVERFLQRVLDSEVKQL